MMRNSLWCVVVAAVAFGAPSTAQAQDDATREQLLEATNAEIEALVKDASDLRIGADKKLAEAEKLRAAGGDANNKRADELEASAARDKATARGLLNQRTEAVRSRQNMLDSMEEATARMEGEKARAESERAYAESQRPPGFWSKVGDKAIDIIGSLLQSLLQKWLAGGGEDDELLNQINDLQDERDRLLNERENPEDSNGVGRIITDPNGNYGYDRDGDGFVDIPLNPDGTPAGDFNPTNEDAFNTSAGITDTEDDDDLAGLNGLGGGGLSGGGANFGGGGGGPNFGGIGAPGEGGLAGAGDEDDNSGFPGASTEDGDEDGDGIPDSEDEDTEKADEDGEAVTIKGRIVLLRKLEIEEVAGDHEEGGEWGDDFEEWGDDDWDDSADNGDKDSEFGEEDFAGVGDAKTAAKLVDEVVRVETVIQQWRKAAESDEVSAGNDEEDDFGFQDDEMAGYRAPGKDKEEQDTFEDIIMSDGKIDLTKVEIWVIEKDTWKEGKTPIRYKLQAPFDLEDFDPKHGGWITARGLVEDLEVEEGVMATIKGKVKKVELVAVIATLDEVPENMNQFDDDKPDDTDVGGLDEDDLDGFGEDEDW